MAARVRRPSLDHPDYDPLGIVCCYREVGDEDPQLVRQQEAGEEDQSQPGWDQGA